MPSINGDALSSPLQQHTNNPAPETVGDHFLPIDVRLLTAVISNKWWACTKCWLRIWSVCVCVGTHVSLSACSTMEESILSIHFQPCAQPCPSSVPAPDTRVAYLMDSLGDTPGLLGQAPLVQSQVVCRKLPSWCYLLLPPGSTARQAPDKCHLHPNKWLSWFQNRECESPMSRSKAISYHRLAHSPHSAPWCTRECWGSERQLSKLSLSTTGDRLCEKHLAFGWVTPLLPVIFSPISGVGCPTRLWPRNSLGVAWVLTSWYVLQTNTPPLL